MMTMTIVMLMFIMRTMIKMMMTTIKMGVIIMMIVMTTNEG